LINRLCIIGVGLIGGSLALALKKYSACQYIIGCGRSIENLHNAIELGVIDDYHTDPAVAVQGCDVVLLAIPVGGMRTVMAAIKPALTENMVITDAGSTKGSIIEGAREVFGDLPGGLIPGHPVAGNENSGVIAATADLYRGCRVILTPHENSHEDALNTVTAMWRATGAQVNYMDAELHDHILASTSHLPHMLAFSLVRELVNSPHHDNIFRYAAGGLRDFTRIAESDPVMWRDICLSNKDAILAAIDRYRDELERLQRAICESDADTMHNMFAEAHDARARFRCLLDIQEQDCQ